MQAEGHIKIIKENPQINERLVSTGGPINQTFYLDTADGEKYETLEQVFKAFLNFGTPKNSVVVLPVAAGMDNVKFAKFFRDLDLLDPRFITPIEVDIMFKKVKSKNERRIDFDQFKDALKQLAEKRYPTSPAPFLRLQERILNGRGPKSNKVTTTKLDPILKKLTDVSLYTGCHKERFDANGRGLGKAGRQDNWDMPGFHFGYSKGETVRMKPQQTVSHTK